MGKRKTNESFKEEIRSMHGDDYSFLEKYVNMSTKLKVRHNICGHEYRVAPRNFIHKKDGCPNCWESRRKYAKRIDPKDFLERIEPKMGSEFLLMDDYEVARKRVRVKHIVCGCVFSRLPAALIQSVACPNCTDMSSGEYIVSQWLKANGFEFVQEKSFEDCYYERLLRYDFAILDDEKNVLSLIEYNGLQHYQPIEHFGGEKVFEEVRKRDELKIEYARKNNIPLITVRYDEDVDEVLSKLIPR